MRCVAWGQKWTPDADVLTAKFFWELFFRYAYEHAAEPTDETGP